MRRRHTWFVSSIVLFVATSAAGQVRPMSVEGSAYGGIWEGDAVFDNAAVAGARVLWNITRIIGIEATYGAVLTTQDDRAPGGDAESRTVSQFGANALLDLSDGPLTPYLTAGAGFVRVEETHLAFNAGLGARYWFTDEIGARLDLRGWFSDDAPADDEYAHFEATAGVAVQLGGDYDIDDDGVENADDRCPTTAEDRDGFRDGDGCPDRDDDEDGIADADDKCPRRAEDHDGDRDDDGCPDLDDDGDGVLNDDDRCPAEAEDADEYQDEEGCPDPDNDGDGVADPADKCPLEPELRNGVADEDGCPEKDTDGDGVFDVQDECDDAPETRNGYQDADGCADEVPEALRGALGIVTGVRFARRDEAIDRADREALEPVVEALRAHPGVRVRIAATAHGTKDDEATSLARAASVRDHFVAQGLDAGRFEVEGLGAAPLPEDPPRGARKDRIELSLIVPPAPAAGSEPAAAPTRGE